MRIIAIGFLALAVSPVLAGAQQSLQSASPGATAQPVTIEPAVQPAAGGTTVQPAAVGPTIESAAAGFRATADKNSELIAAAQVRRGQGRDVALMAVGVGAMIVGAIVGDDAGTIILVGGAALALWGLYNYLE